MIIIKKPRIESNGNCSRLIHELLIDGNTRTVWFEVEKKYEKYLCYERSDAMLIGLLSWAMRLNHDIKCEAPVTDDLLYNIEQYVIPSLSKYAKKLYSIKIDAEIAPSLDNAGAVGTSCSLGVDSLHSILNNLNSKYPNCRLTHIVLDNVGAFGRTDEQYMYEDDIIKIKQNNALEFAKEIGVETIFTNSNFADVIIQRHLWTHTYSSLFSVFSLQKLYKTYFYASSGLDLSSFNLKKNDLKDSSYTELLLLQSFRTRNLVIYSEGSSKNRLEKLKFLADNKYAQKYLQCCLTNAHNCNVCEKCVRTMNELYALNKLDNFAEVFDVKKYKNNKDFYLGLLYFSHLKKEAMVNPEYDILKDKISFYIKIKIIIIGFFKLIRKKYRILTNSKKLYKPKFE